MTKSLLVVEEALRDLKAHWFEYIKTISSAAQKQDWKVEVACYQDVVPQIQQTLSVFPIFRYARYLDNKTTKLPGDRYYGFILHSWRCLKVLWPLLNQQQRYDAIFAPTVVAHHLLCWWMIMNFHPRKPKHLTLFFVTNPGVWDKQQQTSILPKSAKIQGILLKRFKKLVEQQKVTFGVETKGAQREFEALTGLPFKLLPHPVPALNLDIAEVQSKQSLLAATVSSSNAYSKAEGISDGIVSSKQRSLQQMTFACYGFARYEKGSDILKAAIEQVLAKPDIIQGQFRDQFQVQWVEPFTMPDGSICEPGSVLEAHTQVKLITRPLVSDDYQMLLQQTDCMVLPYRNSSYYARVSRVAIEAAYLGIPMIYTQGGWLAELVEEFGAGIGIEDENVDQLVNAIEQMAVHLEEYRQAALSKVEKTRTYFSAENFWELLL